MRLLKCTPVVLVSILRFSVSASRLIPRQNFPSCTTTCRSSAAIPNIECATPNNRNPCICSNAPVMTIVVNCILLNCSGSDVDVALTSLRAVCAQAGIALSLPSVPPTSTLSSPSSIPNASATPPSTSRPSATATSRATPGGINSLTSISTTGGRSSSNVPTYASPSISPNLNTSSTSTSRNNSVLIGGIVGGVVGALVVVGIAIGVFVFIIRSRRTVDQPSPSFMGKDWNFNPNSHPFGPPPLVEQASAQRVVVHPQSYYHSPGIQLVQVPDLASGKTLYSYPSRSSLPIKTHLSYDGKLPLRVINEDQPRQSMSGILNVHEDSGFRLDTHGVRSMKTLGGVVDIPPLYSEQ